MNDESYIEKIYDRMQMIIKVIDWKIFSKLKGKYWLIVSNNLKAYLIAKDGIEIEKVLSWMFELIASEIEKWFA